MSKGPDKICPGLLILAADTLAAQFAMDEIRGGKHGRSTCQPREVAGIIHSESKTNCNRRDVVSKEAASADAKCDRRPVQQIAVRNNTSTTHDALLRQV